MKDYFARSVKESCEVKEKSAEALSDSLEKAIDITYSSLKSGKKLLICGNGGSASDAQHVAAEFVVRLKKDRKAYPAIALTTDTSIITSCGNDYSFDLIFSRQVEALGSEGDVLMAISTSGNSKNILLACEEAAKKKMKVIGFTGEGGGKIRSLCDVLIDVKSKNTMRIQETHISFFHILCDILEDKLAGG